MLHEHGNPQVQLSTTSNPSRALWERDAGARTSEWLLNGRARGVQPSSLRRLADPGSVRAVLGVVKYVNT
jgi:hypothetical protein